MTKSIYIGAMTGTSCDAIDISFITVNKSIKLKFFHSAKIPKKTMEPRDLIFLSFSFLRKKIVRI